VPADVGGVALEEAEVAAASDDVEPDPTAAPAGAGD
jgi:hypothetical protein